MHCKFLLVSKAEIFSNSNQLGKKERGEEIVLTNLLRPDCPPVVSLSVSGAGGAERSLCVVQSAVESIIYVERWCSTVSAVLSPSVLTVTLTFQAGPALVVICPHPSSQSSQAGRGRVLPRQEAGGAALHEGEAPAVEGGCQVTLGSALQWQL